MCLSISFEAHRAGFMQDNMGGLGLVHCEIVMRDLPRNFQ